MKQKKLTMSSNLSNQANMNNSERTEMSQFNFFLLFGHEYLYKSVERSELIPLSISINRRGELEISGMEEESLKNIHIYTDKKVTSDEETASP